MHRVWVWLPLVLGLAVSSSAQGEVFVTTLGFPCCPTVLSLDPVAQSANGPAITGLQPAEVPLGVAFRPATGELYLIGSTSRLYRLSFGTGVATPIGSAFVPALTGTEFGIAFDNADRLRVVSDTGQNLRIDPATGAVTVDTPLAFAVGDPHFGQVPRVGAIAYDHRNGSATAYAVDAHLGVLARLGSATAADGLLSTIMPFSTILSGFDISRETGVAYGLEPGFAPQLVTIDLATGATTSVGIVGGQFSFYRGLAIGPSIAIIPTLSWQGLAGLALALAVSALLLRRKWRRVKIEP